MNLIDLFQPADDGLFPEKNIFLFQKLLYAYLSVTRRRHLFYIHYYWWNGLRAGKYVYQ